MARRLPQATTDPDVARRDMDESGYCMLRQVLDDGEVGALRRRLAEQVEAEAQLGSVRMLPDRKQLVLFLLNKGQVFRDLLMHARVHAVIRHVLGEQYLLSTFHAHLAHPGSSTAFHTDQFWMPPPTTEDKRTLVKPGSVTRAGNRGHHVGGDELLQPKTIAPAVVCNAMWMLDDFTAENGATLVVPGSHLSGRQPDHAIDGDADWVPAIAPAGSVVIFEGRTWHSTGVNRTDAIRIGLNTNFCAPQFRQQENYLLGTRPEVLEAASPELRALIGFRAWQGYGGFENSGDLVERGVYAYGELTPASD